MTPRRRLFWLWVRWWLSPRAWVVGDQRRFRAFYWRNRREIQRRTEEQDRKMMERLRYEDLIPVARDPRDVLGPGLWTDRVVWYPFEDEETD